MNEVIEVLKSVGIAIIMSFTMYVVAILLVLIILPFAVTFCMVTWVLCDIIGVWTILGITIGIVLIYFARQIYKDIL
ncbi:hypothetical protein [Peptostreptococcus porci]|uniref:hypothetical protein n=1 Tax=Peptostreptococcus porci TaxID=2652282 RepID=UPI002A80D4E6|nr:hypothetical protein [Peptostreptococcus porci]MDY4127702.1 hypothetical protein [Peptostreptococcus porci]